MTREPSWREVARVLAERMEIAAGHAGASDPYDARDHAGCSHSVAQADPDNCPFCADRAAFLLYRRKLRSVAAGSNSGGESR